MIADEYLKYPARSPGLDHDWFDYRCPRNTPPLRWPGEAQLALWITVPLEFFPLNGGNAPFRPTGALDRPYPDLWSYAARDYGLRVGIYRIINALDQRGIRATAAVNSAVAVRIPKLIDMLVERRWEIMCAGVDMGTLHYSGLPKNVELDLISRALSDVRSKDRDVIGWHSPGYSQSMHTMEILSAEGVRYVADWVNDDLPYDVRTSDGNIVAMPLTYELADRKIMVEHDRTMEEYTTMVLSAASRLRAESSQFARILSLSISPWIIGYHHRIAAFEAMLDAILSGGPIWVATGRELFEAYDQGKTRSTPP
jgi:allantoinase